MNNLLNDARGLIDRICKAMARVEKCETMSDEVSTRQLAFVKPGTDQYLCIDDILTEEQMQDIKKYIQNTIDANKEEAERFLRKVSDNVEPVSVEQAETADSEVDIFPEMTVEEVRKVYTDGTASLNQAAEYFGVGRNKLYDFITKNGLRKEKKDNTPWRNGSH